MTNLEQRKRLKIKPCAYEGVFSNFWDGKFTLVKGGNNTPQQMEYFPTLTNKRCKKKTTPLVAHFHNLTIYSVYMYISVVA